ncbi:MAG: hypothetical protein Kow0063_30230 [Anaerolineae bacterium]
MLPRNVLYYGKDEALPEQVALRAGPLTLLYEGGDLRYIRLGNTEILRRIYVAIRDRNWGTVLPVLSNLKMDIADDSFHISYDVVNKEADIDFFWKGTITGDANGTITFTMDGVARSTFLRNRIGFCILHPMELAGKTCRIEHVDGTSEECDFPQYIAPQYVIDGEVKPVAPFNEMRAMSYQVAPGSWVEIRFAGDIFEMEDQRNWTDASYKTYCTPLRLPFPVEVREGTHITQSVTVSLKGAKPEVQTGTTKKALTFSVASSPAGPLPRIGLGVASHGQPLSQKELARLKALHLSHLRVDLPLSQPGYEARLRQATAEAKELGVSLEVAVILSDAAAGELKELVSILDQIKPPVWAWLVFHKDTTYTDEETIRLAREHLARYDSTVKLGSGTNAFFTELNRNRPPFDLLDLVCYSLNPQVHAFDNLSLAETLAAQAATVESTRQFCQGLPIAVSPVTLKMRFNPNATGPEPEPEPGELPPQVDVRQMSLFGAGWTLGSLKYLAESGPHSITYYETTGWRGVMETEAGSPLPDKFRSIPGAVFPMYHVLADVGEFAGGQVVPTTSSDALLVDGLALRKDGKTRVILANLSPDPQQVSLQNLSPNVQVAYLDETNVEAAMVSAEEFRAAKGKREKTTDGSLALKLMPYAIARIDSV